MESVDAVVIGAGVVGLAVARALAQAGREVLVLEAAGQIGSGISSRNSEVIHAGLYYATGSLKARLCVAGNRALYAYCAQRGVPHRRCGKLVVATDDAQLAGLKALQRLGQANGVHDLQWLSAEQARALEPELACVAALHSPSTGIVDAHAYMLALQGDVEHAGGLVALHAPVRRLVVRPGDGAGIEVHCDDQSLLAQVVVNAAGLSAPDIAAHTVGLAPEHVPQAYFAKGNYFTLAGRSPFSRLIYPMPQAAGLGVHLTLDLGGQAKFGPDVEWIAPVDAHSIDYTVDARRCEGFYAAVRSYWPGLPDGALQAGYSGVRPKLQAPNQPACDFVVQGPATHGIPGLVNLLGIESPGLTSALALADWVAGQLDCYQHDS